jgi:hypothetical protein
MGVAIQNWTGVAMSFCSSFTWSGRFLNVFYFDTDGVSFYLIWNYGGDG